MIERGASPELLFPLLDRTVELQRPGWEERLERALADADVSCTAIRVALTRPCGDRLKRLAIQRAPQWPELVTNLVFSEEIDDATLALLFDAPDPVVRREAAVMLGAVESGRLEHLPPHILARWRQTVVASPADGSWFHLILEGDAELCADWLRAWFGRCRDPERRESLPQEARKAIASLPVNVRVALVRDIPADASPYLLVDGVESLVSDDLDVATALFERSDIEDVHKAALRRGPSETWMDRALMALDHGWEPDAIIRPMFEGPVDDASRHWEQRSDEFAGLRRETKPLDDVRRERIMAAGIIYCEQGRDGAAMSERHERVFGWGSR